MTIFSGFSSVVTALAIVASATGEVLDNRETCANPVKNCDPNVDHFETKLLMKHTSSVTTLDYENTHILLEQSWPTRGPWMKGTSQKVVFVRCGCPVPTTLSADWSDAKVIHIPVSSAMVQMPNTLSKIYLMGSRSKVVAIESNRYISDATPEIKTDLRDGIVRRLDLAPNGMPSTRITLSFTSGTFVDASTGFRLQLVVDDSSEVLGQTECIYPTEESQEPLEDVLSKAFNSIPGWVDAGKVWVLTSGDASAQPSTSLVHTLYFDSQLPSSLALTGEASTCGGNVEFKVKQDPAPSNRPIYHRLHDLPGGFPDVLITEPRSLGPLADDPKVEARRFLDSDPGEETPLGRAELMKLMALMLGSVETGNTLFDSIELRYETAKALAAKALTRPSVMVGKPGTWNEAARNSWMITVGSTYVGQFLRDANVEYRNSDDSINQAVCGNGGCGVCPSGTSDTRCSVAIGDYLNLFEKADYWIAAGIGANCWSASCNFDLTSDELLDQNRNIFSQFMAMQCGSLIALDKSHSGKGSNSYWETGRIRPDLVLMDLVTLMHPDLQLKEEDTTFFRILEPLSNKTGVSECPRTTLPVQPNLGTVHVRSTFTMELSPSSQVVGPPHFAILDAFYPDVHADIADALGMNVADLELQMTNTPQEENYFGMSVTAKVLNCQDHSCGVEVGEKLDSLGPVIQQSLGLSWVTLVEQDTTTIVLDREGDTIPLELLTSINNNNEVTSDGDISGDDVRTTDTPVSVSDVTRDDDNNDDGIYLSTTVLIAIAVGVVLVFLIGLVVTHKVAYVKGAKQGSATQQMTAQKASLKPSVTARREQPAEPDFESC